jgi:hypothetical protein
VLRHTPGFRLKDMEARVAIVKDREMVRRFLGELRGLGLE